MEERSPRYNRCHTALKGKRKAIEALELADHQINLSDVHIDDDEVPHTNKNGQHNGWPGDGQDSSPKEVRLGANASQASPNEDSPWTRSRKGLLTNNNHSTAKVEIPTYPPSRETPTARSRRSLSHSLQIHISQSGPSESAQTCTLMRRHYSNNSYRKIRIRVVPDRYAWNWPQGHLSQALHQDGR